jgi:DNA-binding GntR family transcriptional regulator
MPEDLLRKTLAEQIYLILREDILQQKILPGAKLTLHVLKDRFGISHTPIREALARLVEDGLVNYYSNVGITVLSLTAKDVREIFQLNCDLDLLAIRHSMSSEAREDFLDALEDNAILCRRLLRKGKVKEWRNASDYFHLAFYRYAGNSRLEQSAFKLRAQLTLVYNMYGIESQRFEQIQAYHDQILERLRQDDIAGAGEALGRHIYEDMEVALEHMAREQAKPAEA